MTANISTATRRHIYRRDGWRCALCDSTQTIQIHHVIPRGQGGTNSIHNLITLCSTCHAQAHGMDLWDTGITAADMEQYCTEYMADLYAPDWNPWKRHPLDG